MHNVMHYFDGAEMEMFFLPLSEILKYMVYI